MGSFLLNATGTGNSFAAQGASSLYNPGTLGMTQGINDAQNALAQTYSNQNTLAGQLAGQASGAGPNPAQLQLQQGTNRAIQQGAGMLASTKGISPALAQRLAAQNAAAQSQAAAGQGALMGANQQIAAQNALGGLYGQMGNQALSQQNIFQNALASWNNNQVGMQSNQNNVNAGVASQNAATKGGLVGGVFNSLGGALGLGGGGGGGGGGGLGSFVSSLFAEGGEVPELKDVTPRKMADGGPVMQNFGFNDQPMIDNNAVQSFAGKFLTSGGEALNKGIGSLGGGQQKMDLAPDPFNGPGASNVSDQVQNTPAKFIKPPSAMARGGAVVPGEAKVKGDSLKNDKVPALLSPKEIVLPRSVTMHPDAPKKAAEFVAAIQARRGRRPMGKAS